MQCCYTFYLQIYEIKNDNVSWIQTYIQTSKDWQPYLINYLIKNSELFQRSVRRVSFCSYWFVLCEVEHVKRIHHSFNFNGWGITQALSDVKETIIYNCALSGRTNLLLISCVWGGAGLFSHRQASHPKTTGQVSDEVAPRLESRTPPLPLSSCMADHR